MISWWAPPGVDDLEGEAVDRVDGIPGDAQVVIVDSRAVDLAGLPALREASQATLVVCCEPAEIDAALAVLGARDDISLRGEPARLVVARARRALVRGLADRDPLTGLLTHKAFAQAFDRAADRSTGPIALAMFDIDHFKRINDAHGHLAGDHILRGVAARLGDAVESPEALGRTGGEEFGALFLCGEDDALARVDAALAAVRGEPVVEVEVTLSAGLAVWIPGAREPTSELWRRADEALYAAKARGRDRAYSYGGLEREAAAAGRDVELDGFENRTRVLADRVAEVIAWRGRRLFEELKEQADVDGLTGLYSRRYFDRRLDLEVDAARSRAVPLSVALIDIDAFGEVNKRHGWPTGDRVLGDIANRIRENVRAGDWVARYGGEEICIVMLDTGLEQAAIVLERIRAAIEAAPFAATDGEALAITASLGAAELGGDSDTLAALLERASARLLDAKGAGKNRVCV